MLAYAKNDHLGFRAAVNAKGGFGVWCADVAYQVALLNDVVERHARA